MLDFNGYLPLICSPKRESLAMLGALQRLQTRRRVFLLQVQPLQSEREPPNKNTKRAGCFGTKMPTVPLYPPCSVSERKTDATPNPLPQLLQTPSGLAILELQGTINLPSTSSQTSENHDIRNSNSSLPVASHQTPVGRLVFPDYDPSKDPNDKPWQKRVHFYVGKHQRLTGEVKKLAKPMAVIRRRQTDRDQGHIAEDAVRDELEIVEIIKHKVIFSSRPEPFTTNW